MGLCTHTLHHVLTSFLFTTLLLFSSSYASTNPHPNSPYITTLQLDPTQQNRAIPAVALALNAAEAAATLFTVLPETPGLKPVEAVVSQDCAYQIGSVAEHLSETLRLLQAPSGADVVKGLKELMGKAFKGESTCMEVMKSKDTQITEAFKSKYMGKVSDLQKLTNDANSIINML